jgi:hypothetical protein
VAWLPPELEIGLEPELKPLEPDEFELEPDEPELDEPVEPEPDELEPVEPEPDELEPDEPEPEPDDELDEPELAELPDEPEDPEEDAVLCVDPGRARATAPAVTMLAILTTAVAERTLARPSSRAAMARRMRSRCALLMCPILRSRTRSLLYEPSRLAMRRAARNMALGRGYPGNMKDS